MNIKKYETLVSGVKATFNQEKAKIANYDKWTPEAKREAFQQLEETTHQKLRDLRQQLAEERESRRKILEQKLFAVGDDAALQLNYRDGIARASSIQSQEQLQDLMTQALETGDKVLAKATAYVAQKHGYFDIAVQAFEGSQSIYFNEYMEIQAALSDPISKDAIEESFLFSSVV